MKSSILVFGTVKSRGNVFFSIVTRRTKGNDPGGWGAIRVPENCFQTSACAQDAIELISAVRGHDPELRYGVIRSDTISVHEWEPSH
jgi:hypothetical protein